MLQLNSKEVICHLCKEHLPYNGNLTNQLWICYMEEHKALKYRNYRDKLYNYDNWDRNFNDTHPYNIAIYYNKKECYDYSHCTSCMW